MGLNGVAEVKLTLLVVEEEFAAGLIFTETLSNASLENRLEKFDRPTYTSEEVSLPIKSNNPTLAEEESVVEFAVEPASDWLSVGFEDCGSDNQDREA